MSDSVTARPNLGLFLVAPIHKPERHGEVYERQRGYSFIRNARLPLIASKAKPEQHLYPLGEGPGLKATCTQTDPPVVLPPDGRPDATTCFDNEDPNYRCEGANARGTSV